MCYIYAKGLNDMKTFTSLLLALVVGVLFVANAKSVSAGQSEYSRSIDATSFGCVRMKHSPVLGINIPITVWIDGQLAGAFAKGHVFERCLSPGRHEIYASRPGIGRQSDSWYGTLDVSRGETLSFVVYCNVNSVILQPVGRVD